MNEHIEKLKGFELTNAEYETFKCLFFHGPTWDGNVPSKMSRDILCRKGYVEHKFAYAWLTESGVEFAVKVLELDKLKDKWERDGRKPYLDYR
jgi:hypothetical protein